jgi:Bacterial Ig-like domain (group 3)
LAILPLAGALIAPASAAARQVLYVGNDNTPGHVLQFSLPLTSSTAPNFSIASNNVVAVAADASGNLAVGDNAGNLSFFSAPLSSASTPSASFKNGAASNNGQIAFTNAGDFWAATVSNRANGFTNPFSNASTPSAFVTDGGMVSDIGTAFDPAQNLYISNAGTGNAGFCAGTSQPGGGCASNLYVYAPPYTGAPIITPSVANFPFGSASTAYRKIAVNGTRLYAASVANAPGRVDVYNLPLTASSTPSFLLESGVNTPEGLALDSSGNLYIGNLSDATVTVYTAPITASSVPSLIFKVSSGAFAIFGIAVGPATTNPTTTATALASSANPSTGGQQVTFTAPVTPTPDGGTVAFTDGGTPISGCSAVSLTAGVATCPIVYGAGGSHSIQATYSGDSAFASSLSPQLTQVVNTAASATMTSLHGASNPTTTGTAVIYTAQITPKPDGGTVAFFDAGLPIAGCGAASVSPMTGTATCTATYASPGLHLIQSAFSGDTKFVSSQSSTLRERVNSALAVVGSPSGKKGRVTLVESCAAQSSVNCQSTNTLTATETLQKGKPIAVASRAPITQRVVVVGTKRASIKPGQKLTVEITLNRTGRKLLASFGKLPVTLTVALATSPPSIVLRKTLVIKPAPKHHRPGR